MTWTTDSGSVVGLSWAGAKTKDIYKIVQNENENFRTQQKAPTDSEYNACYNIFNIISRSGTTVRQQVHGKRMATTRDNGIGHRL